MKRRTKIRLIAYALAGLTALGGWAAAQGTGLAWHRTETQHVSARAFEETVRAVEALSDALGKSVYATDGGMCARVCGEAYAEASAAEGAMLALPFATQELEALAAFLNVAGDYAISLCTTAAAQGFTEEELGHLSDLSGAAADFADALRQMQSDVNAGDLRYDEREKRLANVDADTRELLSARLLETQDKLETPEPFSYDGRYGYEKKAKSGYLTEDEMLQAAADFAGAEPEALTALYDYEGVEGRRCYRYEDLFLCVSRRGVESMAQSRLVGEAKLDGAQARAIAEDFLASHGFEGLSPAGEENSGTVLRLRYCATQDGVDCPDNALTVAVALDDGSIYSFNAEDYASEQADVRWTLDEESAAAALPANVEIVETKKLICKSEGRRDMACYAFFCQDGEGRAVTVCVDAETGKQRRIELGE